MSTQDDDNPDDNDDDLFGDDDDEENEEEAERTADPELIEWKTLLAAAEDSLKGNRKVETKMLLEAKNQLLVVSSVSTQSIPRDLT